MSIKATFLTDHSSRVTNMPTFPGHQAALLIFASALLATPSGTAFAQYDPPAQSRAMLTPTFTDISGKPVSGLTLAHTRSDAKFVTDAAGTVTLSQQSQRGWYDFQYDNRSFKAWLSPSRAAQDAMLSEPARYKFPLPATGPASLPGSLNLHVKVTLPQGGPASGAWVCVHRYLRLDEPADWSWLWAQADQNGVVQLTFPRQNTALIPSPAAPLWIDIQAVTPGKDGLDTGILRRIPAVSPTGQLTIDLPFTADPPRALESEWTSGRSMTYAEIQQRLNVYQYPPAIDHPGFTLPFRQNSIRPVWWTFEAPRQIPPGKYSASTPIPGSGGSFTVTAATGAQVQAKQPPPQPVIPTSSAPASAPYPPRKAGFRRVRITLGDSYTTIKDFKFKLSVPGQKWSQVPPLVDYQFHADIPKSIDLKDVVIEPLGLAPEVPASSLLITRTQRELESDAYYDWSVRFHINRFSLNGCRDAQLTDAQGRPMANVALELQGFTQKLVLKTNSQGRFYDSDINYNFLALRATLIAPGLTPMRLASFGENQLNQNLGPRWDSYAPSLVRLPVLLQPDAASEPHFSGQVTGPDGKPVPGCEVWVNRAIARPGQWALADTSSGAGILTDAQGGFTSWPIQPWHDLAPENRQTVKWASNRLIYPWPLMAGYAPTWLAVVRPPAGSGLAPALVSLTPDVSPVPTTIQLQKSIPVALSIPAEPRPANFYEDRPFSMSLYYLDPQLKASMDTGRDISRIPITASLLPGAYRLETPTQFADTALINAQTSSLVMPTLPAQTIVTVGVTAAATGKPVSNALVCAYPLQPGNWSAATWDALANLKPSEKITPDLAAALGVPKEAVADLYVTSPQGSAAIISGAKDAPRLSPPEEVYVYAKGYAPMKCIVPTGPIAQPGGRNVVLDFTLTPAGRVRILPANPRPVVPITAPSTVSQTAERSVWSTSYGEENNAWFLLEAAPAGPTTITASDKPTYYIPQFHWPSGAALLLPSDIPFNILGYSYGTGDYQVFRNISNMGSYSITHYPARSLVTYAGWDTPLEMTSTPVKAATWDFTDVQLHPRPKAKLAISVTDQSGNLLSSARIRLRLTDISSRNRLEDRTTGPNAAFNLPVGTRMSLDVLYLDRVISRPEWTLDVPSDAKNIGPLTLQINTAP